MTSPSSTLRSRRLLLPWLLVFGLGCEEDTDEPRDDGPDAGLAADAGAETADAAPLDADVTSPADDASTGPSAFRPEPRMPSDALIAQLSVPEGFALNVFARDLGHARMLATHGGHVYLTRPQQGDVLRVVDEDGDGVAESQPAVATGLMGVHGIAFHEETVYLATPTELIRAAVDATGNFGAPTVLLDDLPDGGQHPNRTLGVGPDQKLYLSIGSSCNACRESNPEHATMLRAELDGTARSVFASGLRNTIGFDWHPTTNAFWGMDHGSDWLGDDTPPEELNLLSAGKNYGWPYCYGDKHIDPVIEEPPDTTKAAFCAASEPPVLTWTAHGAPIAFTFYRGTSFPAGYRDSAYIALRGSWNRSTATGYKIVRLVFEGDQPVRFEDFVSGFLIEDGKAQFGRLAGLTVAPDGALLFTDDQNGFVYRVQAMAP